MQKIVHLGPLSGLWFAWDQKRDNIKKNFGVFNLDCEKNPVLCPSKRCTNTNSEAEFLQGFEPELAKQDGSASSPASALQAKPNEAIASSGLAWCAQT